MDSKSRDATCIEADAAESRRLMTEWSIRKRGRYYHFDGYRYEVLANAIAFAQLVQERPWLRADLATFARCDIDEAPNAADRQCMRELAITFESHRFVVEGFQYDRLIDAANYARHRRQIRAKTLGTETAMKTGNPEGDRRQPFGRIWRAWSRRPRITSRPGEPPEGHAHDAGRAAAAVIDVTYAPRVSVIGVGRIGPARRQREAESRWENEGGATREANGGATTHRRRDCGLALPPYS